MWIFSQYGFFSVVRESASGLGSEASVARVQVRARHRAHLEGLRTAFPALLADAPIVGYDDPAHEAAYGHRDYEYRLFLTPAAWRQLAAAFAADLDYPNFKSRVSERSEHPSLSPTNYLSRLYDVYHAMERTDRY
jgi:hypothetical protein